MPPSPGFRPDTLRTEEFSSTDEVGDTWSGASTPMHVGRPFDSRSEL
jgi:hypothetical protein